MRFIDTNIFIRFVAEDDPAKTEACGRLFARVREGREEVVCTETIIAEIAYVLSGRSLYRLAHAEIAARLRPILGLPGLKLPGKRRCLRALDIYASNPSLDFEDALTVAHMEEHHIDEIVSYDRDFDRIPGIRRIEP